MPCGSPGRFVRVRSFVRRSSRVQGVTTVLVLLGCGLLVLYPIVFLAEESLNTGDPVSFPAEKIGLDNYANVFENLHVLGNTALVACMATAMTIVVGFLLAWIFHARISLGGGNSST